MNPVYSASLIVAVRGYMVPNMSITFIFNLASVPQTDRALPIKALMLYFIMPCVTSNLTATVTVLMWCWFLILSLFPLLSVPHLILLLPLYLPNFASWPSSPLYLTWLSELSCSLNTSPSSAFQEADIVSSKDSGHGDSEQGDSDHDATNRGHSAGEFSRT